MRDYVNTVLTAKSNFRNLKETEDIKALYEFKKKLGSGSYGTVYQAINKVTKEHRAVKVIVKERESLRSWHDLMQSELMMLQKLNHANFVRVHELYEDPKHIYVVAELIEHGDLLNVL